MKKLKKVHQKLLLKKKKKKKKKKGVCAQMHMNFFFLQVRQERRMDTIPAVL